MMALLLLLLADGADQEFLAARASELAARYDQLAARQTPTAVRERTTVVRELGHLPFEDKAREKAARLLARIVTEDRSYRVRSEASRAIARVGTPQALDAMIRALFGPAGREPRFELLHAVLPEALSSLRRPDDLDWIADRILRPAAGGGERAILAEAGPLERELVILTLEGLGRARARQLGPRISALARGGEPEVRAAALSALAGLGLEDPAFEAAIGDPDERVRAAAASSAALAWEQAGALLWDRSPFVRRGAVRGLSTRRHREAVTLLVDRLGVETDGTVRLDLADALQDLTGKDFHLAADLWQGWWASARDAYEGPVAAEPGQRVYFFDVGLRTTRVTFVIDVSASMSVSDASGISRLAAAAREVGRTVGELAPAARFRVLSFSTHVRGWPEIPGDRTGAAAAMQELLSQKPAGATNTYAALMTALEDPFAPDTIVLLSDGSPYRCAFRGKTYSEPEQILAEVRRANARRRVRIHAVALRSGDGGEEDADDTAVDFLRRLAAENRGEFREIR